MHPHLDGDEIVGFIARVIFQILFEIFIHFLFQWILVWSFHTIGQYFGLTRGWALVYIPVGIGFGWAVHQVMNQFFQSSDWGVAAGIVGFILLLIGTAYVHRYFLGHLAPPETEM